MKKMLHWLRPAVFVLLAAGAVQAQSLRAGAARVEITPPAGTPLAGYYYNRGAVGTHDNLYAKALVLQAGGDKVALVAVDMIFLPQEITDAARRIIAQRTGLAADHVMISATHTHTGPVLSIGPWRNNLDGEMKRLAVEFTASLPGKIADAVVAANAALQPAQLRAGIGREDTLEFNRRYFMKDGTVKWNPGKLNPQIVRPAGPTDPAVDVMYVETPQGKGIASYVNYALHQDTTGGEQFSADYAYTIERVMHMAKGDGLVSMFTIGCAGNINHFNTSLAGQQQGYEEAARIGAVIAGDELKVIESAPLVPVDRIQVSRKVLVFPVPKYTPEEIAWANKTQATYGTANAAPMLDLVKAQRMLELAARNGKPIEAEVQVIVLGGKVAFASFPGEMFVELGLSLKQDSPYPYTFAVELANGELSYIPNRAAYPEGEYEVVSARVGPGAGESMIDSALKQMDELVQQSPKP